MARERKFPDARHVRPALKRPEQSDPGPLPTPMRKVRRANGNITSTKWKDEFLPIILQRCAMGDTDAQIARLVGVSPNLMWKWRQMRPDLKNAMNNWRASADDRVVRSLYERAVGYTFESEVIKVIDDRVVRVKTLQHVPPDVKAIETWLYNRRGAEWRMKQEITLYQPDDPHALTTEELMRIAAGEDQPKLTNGRGNGKVH